MQKIIYEQDGGVAVITPTGSIEDALAGVPEGASYEIVEEETLPADRLFRSGWKKVGAAIAEDLSECREIAHTKRRSKRQKDLAPLDIQATIPAQSVQAEAARQTIRDTNAALQTDLDNATNTNELRQLMSASNI